MGKLRPAVVLLPMFIFALLVVAGVRDGESFIAALNLVFQKLMINGGWLASIGVLIFVLFLIVILLHPVGNIKLGGPSAKPEYSLWNWFAVSLCAGIGTGIVFWGPVEPLLFTVSPQESTGIVGGTYEALTWAFDKSYLHWSFAPYACYCIFGVALAYAFYNLRSSFSVSSSLASLLGRKSEEKKTKGIIDTVTVFALVGGVAGSLGYGLLQIASGLETVFGIEPNTLVYVVICLVIVVSFTAASITGIDRGIRWIADKNAWIFLALMLVAFIFGPAQWICNILVDSFGSFVSGFVASITGIIPVSDAGVVVGSSWHDESELWSQWWDQYFFIDFLSFGPIVGLFSIKLAKGRTLRQFVVMNWVVPAMFGILWFAIFGGLALDIQYNYAAYAAVVDLQGCSSLYEYMQVYGNEAMMLKVVEALPFAFLVKPLILLLVAISFITLADAMTSTISLVSLKNSKNIEEAPVSLKLLWGIVIGAAALIFMLTGSIDGIKIVKTIAGYPILIFGLVVVVFFIVAMLSKKTQLNKDIRKYNTSCIGDDFND